LERCPKDREDETTRQCSGFKKQAYLQNMKIKVRISLLSMLLLFFGCKKYTNTEKIQDANDSSKISAKSFYSPFEFGSNDTSFDYYNMLKIDFEKSKTEYIDSVLQVMYGWDQKYRGPEIHKLRNDNLDDAKKMYALINERRKVDSINYIVLRNITNEMGWPDNKRFSNTAIDGAFLIVLHMNGKNQENPNIFSHPIENAFKDKQISAVHYATLTDHILLRNKLKQRYGTHCKNNGGKVIFRNMPDVENVDKNRKKIGLPLLDTDSCELMSY